VLSIGSLRLKTLKYQVQQLTWTIVTLCLVIGQMKFVAHNIFNGLFWFFFPCFLVISNDCWACVGRVGRVGRVVASLSRRVASRRVESRGRSSRAVVALCFAPRLSAAAVPLFPRARAAEAAGESL